MNFSLGVNNGQEGLPWVKAVHRRHPNIPIVLMTAYADVKIAVKGLKSGAVDFVTKPWDNHDLVRVLKDAIDANTEVVPLEKMEEEHVRKVVDKCHGNISAYLEHPKVVGTSLEKGVRAINDAAGNLVTFVDSYRKLTQLQEPVIATLQLKDFLEGIMELYPKITWEIGVPVDTYFNSTFACGIMNNVPSYLRLKPQALRLHSG